MACRLRQLAHQFKTDEIQKEIDQLKEKADISSHLAKVGAQGGVLLKGKSRGAGRTCRVDNLHQHPLGMPWLVTSEESADKPVAAAGPACIRCILHA